MKEGSEDWLLLMIQQIEVIAKERNVELFHEAIKVRFYPHCLTLHFSYQKNAATNKDQIIRCGQVLSLAKGCVNIRESRSEKSGCGGLCL